jgi:hypothetical protein
MEYALVHFILIIKNEMSGSFCLQIIVANQLLVLGSLAE